MPDEQLREQAASIVDMLMDKKAVDVVMLETGQHSVVADWFVIASARNQLHLQALAQALEDTLDGLHHREGRGKASWYLMDYGAIVVHLFTEEARRFYDLERLWGDVPRYVAGERFGLTPS